MFLIPPVAIFFAIYNALRCYKKGAAPTKAMKIHFATLVAVTALCITGAMTALADTGDAAAAVTSNGDGLKYLAAGLCTGIAAIGGGVEGVTKYWQQMQGQLVQAMLLTGCASLADVREHIIYRG